AESRAHQHLEGSVTEELEQPALAQLLVVMLFEEAVKDPGLTARRPTHAGRIIHHDQAEKQGYPEQRVARSLVEIHGGGEGGYRRRVRRRHASGLEQTGKARPPVHHPVREELVELYQGADREGDEEGPHVPV